ALPHTPNKLASTPVLVSMNSVPFQCMARPASPTIHTSFGPLPHTEYRLSCVSVDMGSQNVPSKWITMPSSPTAQMSDALLPHRPNSDRVPVLGTTSLQDRPFQRSTAP